MAYIALAPGAPLGDALLAGVGTGVLEKFEVIKEWVKVTEMTKTNPENKAIYDRYYNIYKKLYEANSEIFKLLSQIPS